MSKRDYQDALADLEHNLKLSIEFTEAITFSDFEADYRAKMGLSVLFAIVLTYNRWKSG